MKILFIVIISILYISVFSQECTYKKNEIWINIDKGYVDKSSNILKTTSPSLNATLKKYNALGN